jgi:hypothetical protein
MQVTTSTSMHKGTRRIFSASHCDRCDSFVILVTRIYVTFGARGLTACFQMRDET